MSGLRQDRNGHLLQAFVPGVTQNVTVGAASLQSAAFGDLTRLVRLAATTDCFVVFGADPTATTSSMFLPSGAVEYLAVEPGTKVAVIRQTADGALNVTEMA